jgi:ubiquinone/menaquinone biosynthesis C-methylase UbiE
MSNQSFYQDKAQEQFTHTRQELWDKTAIASSKRKDWSHYYHHRLEQVFRFLIPKGSRVLEVGCGQGDLLASVQAEYGVGIDFSNEMIQLASARHPQQTFLQFDAHQMPVFEKPFDFVILSDLVNDVWDVQTILNQLKPLVHPQSRIILNIYNRLWEIPLKIAQGIGVAKPLTYQNWLTNKDMQNLLELCGFEIIRTWHEILFPLSIPLLSPFFNHFLARLWPFNHLCMTNFMIARPKPLQKKPQASVSVIVPARNEAGNILEIFERVPQMGSFTELIFVEGHSRDNTFETIQKTQPHFNYPCQIFQQSGVGKGDAVRLGFQKARGDILMILDADLTVPPEDLPRFYDAITQGNGDFINGVRLVYPMEKEAMRFLNFLGNKFFSMAFSWLLGQSIKDTLCGTKVIWKNDYEKIAQNRSYFGDFDPFGDFDLIFGAAKLTLKIIDIPIRYRERRYGTTNIQRWKHGLLLLRMLGVAARRLKFI